MTYYNQLCIKCFNCIKTPSKNLCKKCGGAVNYEGSMQQVRLCNSCKNNILPYFDFLNFGVVYNDVIAKLISSFKYYDQTSLVSFFGGFLFKAYNDFISSNPDIKCDMIIPISCSYTKLIKRRYNQSALLAKYLSKKTDISYKSGILKKTKQSKSQASLGLSERIFNIEKGFSVKKQQSKLIKHKNIFLIDDIITTGNTINQASMALKLAGASVIVALSVARVDGVLKVYRGIRGN